MMTTKTTVPEADEMSLRAAALVAGLAMLVMAVLAGFANFSVMQGLVVPGDAAATGRNILASAGTFRVALLCFLVVAVLDVVVAWALYELLKRANQALSLLTAWLRVVYAAMLAVALNSLMSALRLFTGAGYMSTFQPGQQVAQAMASVDAFQSAWDMALGVFGLHLLLVGYLIFRARYIPWWVGALTVIAGLGYSVDSIAKLLSPAYAITIAQFTFVGEIVLMLWLLWKGIRGFDRVPEGRG